MCKDCSNPEKREKIAIIDLKGNMTEIMVCSTCDTEIGYEERMKKENSETSISEE